MAKVRTALVATLMTMLLALSWAAPAIAQEEEPDRCEQFGALQPVCEGLDPLNPVLDPIFDGLEELDPLASAVTDIIAQIRQGIAENFPCDELQPLVEGLQPLLGPLAEGYEDLREVAPDPAVLGPIGDTINEALDLIADVLQICAAQEEPTEEPTVEPTEEETEPAEPSPEPELPRTGTPVTALVGALAFGAGLAGLLSRRRFLA